ncbi:hypothetical protein J6590_052344 [Homalodisca vitripennis]|nr:hypothetical protein J6590_052344 [Homalodisca vitripennis]
MLSLVKTLSPRRCMKDVTLRDVVVCISHLSYSISVYGIEEEPEPRGSRFKANHHNSGDEPQPPGDFHRIKAQAYSHVSNVDTCRPVGTCHPCATLYTFCQTPPHHAAPFQVGTSVMQVATSRFVAALALVRFLHPPRWNLPLTPVIIYNLAPVLLLGHVMLQGPDRIVVADLTLPVTSKGAEMTQRPSFHHFLLPRRARNGYETG